MKLIEKLIFAYSLFQTRHLQSQEQMWHTRWVPDFLFVKSRNIQCPNPCSDVLKNPFIMSIQVSNTRDISTCQSRLSCLNENSINFSMSPQYCEPCPGNFCLSHRHLTTARCPRNQNYSCTTDSLPFTPGSFRNLKFHDLSLFSKIAYGTDFEYFLQSICRWFIRCQNFVNNIKGADILFDIFIMKNLEWKFNVVNV